MASATKPHRHAAEATQAGDTPNPSHTTGTAAPLLVQRRMIGQCWRNARQLGMLVNQRRHLGRGQDLPVASNVVPGFIEFLTVAEARLPDRCPASHRKRSASDSSYHI